MKDLFQLDEDVAAVIGGTGELGGQMAEALAAFGAKVAVIGRSEERGQKRVDSIESAGGTAKFFAADGLKADSLDTARQQIKDWAGSTVSVLVNAAGGNRPEATIAPGDDFCKLPLEAWKDVFD